QPPTGPQGATLTIELTGAGTGFQPGTTVSVAGAGVSVGSVSVLSPALLTAEITVEPGAAPGFRDVMAVTDLGILGTEAVTGSGVLEITAAPSSPTILGVTPSSVPVGESATVVVTGAATGFDATSELSLGAGVSIGATTALSATALQAEIIVSEAATVGYRDAVVATGTELAIENVTGPFFVFGRSTGTPTLLSISESIGAPGQSLSVSVTGRNTAFAQGASALSFSGSGVEVLGTTVTSPTTATADIRILPDIAPGLRDVRMSTGTEVAVLLDGFNVSTTTALDRRRVEVFPAEHTFRPVAVGMSLEQVFRVVNAEESTLDLHVDAIEIAGAPTAPFQLEGERSFVLRPGEGREVIVRYAPEVPGVVTSELQVTSDDPDHPLLIVPVNATAGGGSASRSFPNPFGPAGLGATTTIRYQVPEGAAGLIPVSIRIYDLSGREVKTIEDAELPPGHYSSVWDGRSRDGVRVAAGVYLYRLVVDGRATTRKLTVLR
ncbi:MAG TPA: FlgD immunoglobulin-like domain containing protein, partial [bacterium]|nr:FlgD immunoglobulin-like domain containing protein [bacterium]